MAPDPGLKPFAIRLDSPAQNYDSAGMSVEGAKPRDGHLGAILYGEAAANRVRMEGPHSLFATFARIDPRLGDRRVQLDRPQATQGAADLRAGLPGLPRRVELRRRDVSPMAWNGSNGLFAGTPDYVPYTAWRNTPLEDAMRDFLVATPTCRAGRSCGRSAARDTPTTTAGPRSAARSSPGAATWR